MEDLPHDQWIPITQKPDHDIADLRIFSPDGPHLIMTGIFEDEDFAWLDQYGHRHNLPYGLQSFTHYLIPGPLDPPKMPPGYMSYRQWKASTTKSSPTRYAYQQFIEALLQQEPDTQEVSK